MIYLELGRTMKRWSKQKLGRHPKVRLDRNFIAMIENGTGVPTPEQSERLARVLEMPVELLLKTVPDIPKDLPAPVADEEESAVHG